MKLTEKQLSSETIFKGKVFTVTVDTVELPNQNITTREVIHHNGGVCIAAKNKDNKYYMVSQFRYAQNEIYLEFPAGKREKGEYHLVTAQRELMEETGYQANHFEYFGNFVPTCAYDTEVIEMYYAEDLQFVGQDLDPEEFLHVGLFTLDEILEKIQNDEIKDAKTIILAYKLKQQNK